MSSCVVSDSSKFVDKNSVALNLQKEVVPSEQDKFSNEDSDSSLKVDGKQKSLAIVHDKEKRDDVTHPDANIVKQLLAHKFPVNYSPENYKKALLELKYVFIGIGSFLFLVYLGWAAIMETNLTEGGDFVYNAGLVGGSLMLGALIYSVFKRVRSLRRFLSNEAWYYFHIVCGAVGAYLVLLHTSFDLRSTNGVVSLMSTLVVIISGALGRYIYTLSTVTLHRQYVEVKDAELTFYEVIEKQECDISERILKRFSKFASYCFNTPKSFFHYLGRWISVINYAAFLYLLTRRDVNKITKKKVSSMNLSKDEINVLKKHNKQKLKQYMFRIIKMGYTNLIEQVLRHWRILHIPALYILTITAVVHVVVIHMY